MARPNLDTCAYVIVPAERGVRTSTVRNVVRDVLAEVLDGTSS
jgi:hypothetical protein